jgi:hypothetical protein
MKAIWRKDNDKAISFFAGGIRPEFFFHQFLWTG